MSNGERRPNQSEKARYFDQESKAAELFREGQRNPGVVSAVLQAIVSDDHVEIRPRPGRTSRVFSMLHPSEQMAVWERVFWEFGRFKPKLHDIALPPVGRGYWVIVQTPEVPLNRLWRAQKEHYLCESSYGDDLEAALDWKFEKRSARRDGAYAVAVRASKEAEAEYAERSAEWIEEQSVCAITLPERIALEPFFWSISGFDHPDRETVTYCCGSRGSDGRVPGVRWGGGLLGVSWCGPSIARSGIRAREVVSAAS